MLLVFCFVSHRKFYGRGTAKANNPLRAADSAADDVSSMEAGAVVKEADASGQMALPAYVLLE